MFCSNCGATLTDTARFCGQCGQLIRVTTQTQSPSNTDAGADRATQPRHQAPAATFSPNSVYELPYQDYEHPSMQKMNQVLRGSAMLRKTAESISRKVGKPWFESTFNAILATQKRYPRVYDLSRIAAQRLGVRQLPSVYVELDRGYQSATYGSDQDAFVNIGSFLPRFLNDRELLFVLGHEFGHLACHHALWTTVSMFFVGQQRSNLMAEGLMSYISNPLKLIEGGVDSIVTNWMRVADFTADRAALLAVGGFETAKRAIFLLHLKSRKELDEMDIDEWVSQAESQDQTMSRVSQMMTSATPYLGLRLIELRKFAQSPEYHALRTRVEAGCGMALDEIFDENGYLKKPQRAKTKPTVAVSRPPGAQKAVETFAAPPKPAQKVRMLNGNCPKCRAPFTFRLVALPNKPWLDIRCKNCSGTFRLNLEAVGKQAERA